MTEEKRPAGNLPRTLALAASMMIFPALLTAGQESRHLSGYEKCILGVFYQDDALSEGTIVKGAPTQVGHDPVMTAIVRIALARKYGVTIGHEMFFPSGELDTRTRSGIVWLAHEMKHVAQAGAFGPPQDFLQAYTTTIRDGLFSGDGSDAAYMNSPFETDARAVAGAFEKLLVRNNDLLSALAGGDPDKDVCNLVNFHSSEYRSVIAGELGARSRETHKFLIPSFPFLQLKKVTYTFYK